MTRRAGLLSLILVGGILFSPSVAQAQRSGLIIDLGLGPGLVSSNTTIVGLGTSNRESEVGAAVKLNIGGVIGDTFELYLANQIVFHGTARQGADHGATGITAVGVTYPLSPDFSVRGAVGLGREALFVDGWSNLFDTSSGLGLLAGGRYGLSDRWALDLDMMYASWNDGALFGSEEVSVWGAGLTLTWLSR